MSALLCALLFATLPLLAQDDAAEPTNSVAPTDVAAPPTVERVPEDATVTIETNYGGKNIRINVRRDSMVAIGHDAVLKEGESTRSFVVVGGNGVVKGKVREAAVVVGGNLQISGQVGEDAVAVLGDLTLHTNASVKGDVVAVLGDVNIHTNASVGHDVVAAGGSVDVADGATVGGDVQPVDIKFIGMPQLKPLRKWFTSCVLLLRPLSFQVGWVWGVAAVFLLVYMAVAVLLRRPVDACINELTRRPISTFFMGLLTKMLLPIVLIILAITGVGVVVIPFVLAAVFFGAIIGKVALLEYLGDAIRRAIGIQEPFKPVVALLVGAALLTLFYLVPILGLITFAVTGVWGLGIAVSTAFGNMKRETPSKPAFAPQPVNPISHPGYIAPMPVSPVAPTTFASTAPSPAPAATEASQQSFSAPATEATGDVPPFTAPPVPPSAPPPTPVSVPEAYAYPRAGFWERMGAAFLDLVIISILMSFVAGFFHNNLFHRLGPSLTFLVPLAYFAGMWTWKGTTVGGIVLNLKVVRYDGSPLTFSVALVRGLGAALSVVVMFLGFLWIAWDPDKQGWHDRIAGTVVVRLPRANPLVMV